MSDTQTVDQRIIDLETALRTLIIFNGNALATLGRRISAGNPAIADVIASDLAALKAVSYTGIDKALHDHYVDNLIVSITGKA